MQSKAWFTLAILIISVLSVSLVIHVSSWHTPSSADDMLYEEFGPRPSELICKVNDASFEAFLAKEIDFMDRALTLEEYNYLELIDPLHQQYSTAVYNDFGLYHYDINNYVTPTNMLSVRLALAHILDKQYFINTYLAGMARKADSVLAPLPGWYNPGCDDLYNFQPRTTMTPLPDDLLDWQVAWDFLNADLGPPVPDPEYPGEYMFTWPTPFPDPCPHGYPPVPDGHLQVFARADSQPQTDQGYYLEYCCEVALPNVCQALGLPRTRLRVDLYIVPRTIYVQEVVEEQRFHIGTGSLRVSGPEILANWIGKIGPDFDEEVELMLASSIPGSPTEPCTGIYHAWPAQLSMEYAEILIPFWYNIGYKAYLSNWRGVVNEVGFGVDSWWTFMNAWKVGGIGKHDQIRYGWVGDVVGSLNVISASWVYDWNVLSKIYDTLIKTNPYTVTEDRPWIAANWTIGTWEPSPGEISTKVTFRIRQDVLWQDIPPKPDRPWPELREGFTNITFTPVDVAFSIEYIRDNPSAWNSWLVQNIDHVGMNLEYWGDMWPWTTPGSTPPWWDMPVEWPYYYVQNENIPAYDITVYFTDHVAAPWLRLDNIGVLPLIPYHVWKWIPIIQSGSVNAWGEQLVYGCGPWILLSRTPGIENVLIDFEAYWGRPPVIGSLKGTAITVGWLKERPGEGTGNEMDVGWALIFNKVLRITNRLQGPFMEPLSVTYYFDFRIQLWNGTAWIPQLTFQTIPQTVNVPYNSYVDVITTKTFTPDQLKNVTLRIFGKVRVYESFHIECTWATNDFVIDFETPVPEVFITAAADINGDGIVNIADATLLGGHWQYQWFP